MLFLSLISLLHTGLVFAATLHSLPRVVLKNIAQAPGRILVADAQFDFKDYQLTHVCFDCKRPDPNDIYNCTLKFDWYDPNAKLENNVTSCSCSTSWNWDGVSTTHGPQNSYNTENYDICYRGHETFFEMKVTSFAHGNFTLDMGHRYKDSHNFTAPWIYPTTFATPNLSLPLRRREKNMITYYHAGPLRAQITQLTD